MEKGKLPPQAVELEEVILGGLLIDEKGLDEALPILKAKVFYKSKHQEIFKAIESLYLKNDGVDLLTVSEEL